MNRSTDPVITWAAFDGGLRPWIDAEVIAP
jgi:hypothetical protein